MVLFVWYEVWEEKLERILLHQYIYIRLALFQNNSPEGGFIARLRMMIFGVIRKVEG